MFSFFLKNYAIILTVGDNMIRTGNYKSFGETKYCTISISGDKGKSVNYNGNCFPALAPKLSFWTIWHENIGKINEQDNNRVLTIHL